HRPHGYYPSPEDFSCRVTAPTDIYTLSLHDALPILEHEQSPVHRERRLDRHRWRPGRCQHDFLPTGVPGADRGLPGHPVFARPLVGGQQPPNPPTLFLLLFPFFSSVRARGPALLSPAYNNPLICPPLGRDVGPGISPVTMLRWCRQPSPSKATLALFLFASAAGSSPRRSPRPLELGSGPIVSVWPDFNLWGSLCRSVFQPRSWRSL